MNESMEETMLTRYRNTNESPFFAPLALLDWDNPWRAFGNLRQDLDRLFGVYERSIGGSHFTNHDSAELRDAGNEFVVSIDLPGVTDKDVELSVSGDNLYVKATRNSAAPEGYTALRKERASYTFEHAWRLPTAVEAQKTEAKLRDGVLTITLPKTPSAQPRQIQVKAG
jgi:HSP20 family protein